MRAGRLLSMLGAGLLIAALASVDGETLPEGLPDAIVFSHERHVMEQELECATCHVDLETSLASDDRNLPDMDVCADCHDVDDDETCGQCHRNPDEPEAVREVEPTIRFSHGAHLERAGNCQTCHAGVASSRSADDDHLPAMAVCMSCHDAESIVDRCDRCHLQPTTLADIHPVGWRHEHGDRAAVDRESCMSCHREETYCTDCHRGDNLGGRTHELNYRFTHALDVRSKAIDCRRCHDSQAFCADCHESGLRMPQSHSTAGWLVDHGRTARIDIENCVACHDSGDPSCARSGCHADRDGILGTDPPIHSRDLGRFETAGGWHDDNGHMCFQCHQNTHLSGSGFCGYCHH